MKMTFEISHTMRKLRERKGLSQAELGALIGKSDSQIGAYENGKTDIPISVVYKIAEVTGCDITWLMTGKTKDKAAGNYDAQFRVYNEADRKLIVPILVANGYDVGQHKQQRTQTGKTVDYYIHINDNTQNLESTR